jgi:hypothetical protein
LFLNLVIFVAIFPQINCYYTSVAGKVLFKMGFLIFGALEINGTKRSA